MKTIFFKQSVILLLITASFTSCSKTSDSFIESDQSKEVLIPLECTGEIINMGTSPLSRAASNDLVYIQAFTCDQNENLTPYAHGLFDDISNLKIALRSDKEYKFIATMVKDGKNKITKYEEYNSDFYSMPFNLSLTNKFITENSFSEYDAQRSDAELSDFNSIFHRPNIDRYYGTSDTYMVNPEQISPVSINMMRSVFGIKVITENFTNGQLRIEVDGAPDMMISEPNGTASEIISLSDIRYAYETDAIYGGSTFTNNYTEYVNVRISRISNGETILVDEKEVKFTRNMLTTLKVKIENNLYENDMTISTETNEMLDDGQGEIEFVGGDDF